MQIDVHSGHTEFSPALERFVVERLERALRHSPWSVTRVEVFFDDHNGPKPSSKSVLDKQCRAEVRLAGRHPWVVSAQGDDLYKAANLMADKVKRRLEHRIERLHERQVRRRRSGLSGIDLT